MAARLASLPGRIEEMRRIEALAETLEDRGDPRAPAVRMCLLEAIGEAAELVASEIDDDVMSRAAHSGGTMSREAGIWKWLGNVGKGAWNAAIHGGVDPVWAREFAAKHPHLWPQLLEVARSGKKGKKVGLPGLNKQGLQPLNQRSKLLARLGLGSMAVGTPAVFLGRGNEPKQRPGFPPEQRDVEPSPGPSYPSYGPTEPQEGAPPRAYITGGPPVPRQG